MPNTKTLENQDLDYKIRLEVNANTQQVFFALTEGIGSWWGKVSDSKFKTGGQFTITFDNGYWWTFKIMEYEPNQELVWKCINGEPDFNKEWIGHVLHWQLEERNEQTTLNFHQIGLTPELHCYDVCSSTWNMFLVEKLKTILSYI